MPYLSQIMLMDSNRLGELYKGSCLSLHILPAAASAAAPPCCRVLVGRPMPDRKGGKGHWLAMHAVLRRYVGEDELIEVTPTKLRLRKRVLDSSSRKALRRRAAAP